jgi:hypothetical protein
MLERERLNLSALATESETTVAQRSSNYVSVSLPLEERATAGCTTYVQPRFDRFRDYRILSEAFVELDVSQTVSARLAISIRHDSEPPFDVKPTDLQIKNGFSWSF